MGARSSAPVWSSTPGHPPAIGEAKSGPLEATEPFLESKIAESLQVFAAPSRFLPRDPETALLAKKVPRAMYHKRNLR
jgi:hypothetical protein